MKNRSQWCACLVPFVVAGAGCGGDDKTPTDAGQETGASATPQRVLVTANGMTKSQLVAVNVETKKVDGTLNFPGFIGTTDAHSALFPFLLEQSNDVVARLDPVRPWVIDSSWNVALKDEIDGGASYSDPDAIIVGAGNKAYVLRYTRNEIAVIDTTQSVEAGPPESKIDLSSLLQPNDTDGTVEMTAGVYVAAKNRLYVVLANIDKNLIVDDDTICAPTVSTIVGIDTTSDKVVSLVSGHAAGPGGSIGLRGFDPVFSGLVYDSANDRLLVLEAGCNAPPLVDMDAGAGAGDTDADTDGGASSDAGDEGGPFPGPVSKRGVEAVNLADGSTQILLDASDRGFPSGIVYIDATHAVLGFDFIGSEVYRWDPTQSKLGALVSNAPDAFTYDGAGNLLGTVTTFPNGNLKTSVVSVSLKTGKSTTLSTDAITLEGAFIGGVDVWPHP